MKYDYVIWDWNGTLFNDLDASIKSLNKTVGHIIGREIEKKEYLEKLCFPIRDFYIKLGIDFEKYNFEELSINYNKMFLVESMKCPLQQGSKEMLQYISALGMKQAIISASEKSMLVERLVHFDIDRYFVDIVAMEDYFAESKIEKAKNWRKDKLDKTMIMIGDTVHDYKVAQSINIDCVLLSKGHASKERLLATKQKVIDNVADFKEII